MTDEERSKLISQIGETLPISEAIREDFGGLIADTVLGGVWSRPGLSPRERSLTTIAALTALDRPKGVGRTSPVFSTTDTQHSDY